MHKRSRMIVVLVCVTIAAIIALPLAMLPSQAHTASAASTASHSLDCKVKVSMCTEVYDSEKVFGQNVYVGHDEPATLFYSKTPGSGNQMKYQLTLPKDPAPAPLTSGKSFNFQLHATFWFGMAMCDTQSFPEQVSTCTPNSDKNIVDPAVSPAHPGTAFMEMQFYPPGWAPWPAGNSCDPTRWCAALNVDSLSQNSVTGQALNPTCAAHTGVEYVNFAFITKNGQPQPNSPPNPVQATVNTFTPNPATDLFMNSGDRITVTMHDTAHGLTIGLQDQTTHEGGSMTTSAANGFGQVQFDPTGTSCNNIPYDFHPMYSTSSEQTRVPWAAHTYNIAFSDETGHFDYCNGTVNPNTTCTGTEGSGVNQKPADGDDVGCFPASASLLVQISGCLGTNAGFDGVPYQPVWPDGNTTLHPTPVRFTSPTTGANYDINYSRTAFEADLPRIEGTCNRSTGVGCTLIPTTDSGVAAAFYPFFSTTTAKGNCLWQEGSVIPHTAADFGGNAEYGSLLTSTYSGINGVPFTRINNFRQVMKSNACPSFK